MRRRVNYLVTSLRYKRNKDSGSRDRSTCARLFAMTSLSGISQTQCVATSDASHKAATLFLVGRLLEQVMQIDALLMRA